MGGFASKSFQPERDLPSLKGKVVLVTGANAGIGYATVKHLVRRGAKVYLGARAESKAIGAIASFEAEGLGDSAGEVLWARVDLSDPTEAKKCAEEFLARESRLDILINNAGMSPFGHTFRKTSNGISDIMVVNHFSPFVFTQTLLSLLKHTAELPDSDVRIVNVASQASKFVPKNVHFKTVEDFNRSYDDVWFWPALKRYGASKLCNILWTRALQARLEGTSIIAISLHPGEVNTSAGRLPFSSFFEAIFPYVGIVSPHEGAYTSIIAAASPDVRAKPDVYKGAYLLPIGRVSEPTAAARNDELAQELWEGTEMVLKNMGL
ncbi:hypothetical protein PLICRDRAFT_696844 [Plicaturopsis crispa FD-325 SS-3]|nr:hypothetical protein PLICRDRAFT_696844 [Plicaturopsis crispa FD-325 SS-3]